MTDQGFGVVRPLPGNGLVAHMGGLLLVCDATEAAGEELLQALRETAASGGDGRALARRAAQVLARSMTGDPATCAVAGPGGEGTVAVLVSGAASALVRTGDGEQRLSGSDALTWTDRLIKGPVLRVELSLPGAGPAHPAVRLDGGVVVGGGVVLDLTEQGPGLPVPPPPAPSRPLTAELPNTAYHVEPDLLPPRESRPEPQAPGPMSGPQLAGPPFPGAERQEQPPPDRPPVQMAPYPLQGPSQPQEVPPPPPERQPPSGPAVPGPPSGPMPPQGPPSGPVPQQGPPPGPMHGAPPFEEPREATAPEAPQPQPQEEPQGEGPPLVYGVDCKNDHFNDPRLPYCAICGVALVQRTLVPYKAPRPQLGTLVLDDGTALPLDGDYLLGRDPERAPEVSGGAARPAKVTSPDGSVSRRHLRVALDGWDVNLVDLGSVNGTQIQPPNDPNFYDIPPNEPVTITPGTTVRIGVSRTMRFEPRRG
ncbi:FHA domain-containing protein [Thermoactinospora rubra]|uniref:FHA domain-containing protein n=1 Tax=Thermoactinospora rubra TaxID=1088767 RepID=UPI000A0FBC39|nr:FHA domain-containing protein [Thermoactinospora rubra]